MKPDNLDRQRHNLTRLPDKLARVPVNLARQPDNLARLLMQQKERNGAKERSTYAQNAWMNSFFGLATVKPRATPKAGILATNLSGDRL